MIPQWIRVTLLGLVIAGLRWTLVFAVRWQDRRADRRWEETIRRRQTIQWRHWGHIRG